MKKNFLKILTLIPMFALCSCNKQGPVLPDRGNDVTKEEFKTIVSEIKNENVDPSALHKFYMTVKGEVEETKLDSQFFVDIDTCFFRGIMVTNNLTFDTYAFKDGESYYAFANIAGLKYAQELGSVAEVETSIGNAVNQIAQMKSQIDFSKIEELLNNPDSTLEIKTNGNPGSGYIHYALTDGPDFEIQFENYIPCYLHYVQEDNNIEYKLFPNYQFDETLPNYKSYLNKSSLF